MITRIQKAKTQTQRSLMKSNRDNNGNTSSTLLVEENYDPWNLTMFVNMELDEVITFK